MTHEGIAQVHERRFDSVDEMARSLANRVAETIREATVSRGQTLLALSGGRFPRHLFRALHNQALPWDRVLLVLADERWVDASSEQSNERLVRSELLTGAAAGARLIGLKIAGSATDSALAQIEQRLAELPLPFDMVLLGMGDDGHTASLFPSAPIVELENALAPANNERAAILHPSVSAVPRISLTLPTLIDTRALILHIPGAGKLETLRRAFKDGPVAEMPVRAVLRQSKIPTDILICENEDP